MCIKMRISDTEPLRKLINNPYFFGILKKDLDFDVELIENESNASENRYLLFKRKYNHSIGYVLIFSVEMLNEKMLQELHDIYRKICGKYSNYNFRECDFIIIAQNVEENALVDIKEYNEKYIHRRPIIVILNEVKN